MNKFVFFLLFSLVFASTPALVVGGLVSLIDVAAGYAVFIGLFGWLFSCMLIKWGERHNP